MRRLWAAVLAVWSTIAIVGVLAWSHPAATTTAGAGAPVTVVVQGKNGTRRLARVVVLPSGSTSVATTSSSATAGATTAATGAPGVVVPASSVQPQVTTRSS